MFRFTIRELVLVTASAAQFLTRAEGDESSFDYRSAIQAATTTLEKEHYTRRKLDDKLSAEWLVAFVTQLDPRRMYFLQSDIADFNAFGPLLDDHAKTGDFRFPELVRSRYRERVVAATAATGVFLDARHDFSADESLPSHFDTHARTAEELRERWRMLIKGELLIEKAHGRPLAEAQAQLRGRYARIAKQARELTDERLCEIYLNALARIYDPHSYYWGPTHSAFYAGGLIRNYTLGLQLREELGRYRIRGIDPALQSERALALVGYELTAIKQNDGTIIDLVEMHPADVYRTISSSIGPIKTDSQVGLELLDPITLQRKSVPWNRLPH